MSEEGTDHIVPLTDDYLNADKISSKGTLIIMVGIPRSGKTTRVNNILKEKNNLSNVQLVCRDDIRRALGFRFNRNLEKEVSRTANLMIKALLLRGLVVIADECNVTKNRRATLINIAKTCSASWDFVVIPIPSDEELERRCKETNFDISVINKFKSIYEPVTEDEFENS